MRLPTYSRFLFHSPIYPYLCRSSNTFKRLVTSRESKMYSLWIRNINSGRYHHKLHSVKNNANFSTTASQICNKLSFVNLVCLLRKACEKMPVILRGHSLNIVRHCVEQCEFIIAYRIRRSQQVLSLYTKLWDEMTWKQFVVRFHNKFGKIRKSVLLSASVLFNWDKERISDDEIFKHRNEFKVVEELKNKKYCKRTQEDDKCDCFNCLQPGELEWNVFVSEENLIVWKKEETNHIGEGLFCYKLHATYNDVTALEFLEAQIDLKYRLSWDDHAVKLFTIDSEKSTHSDVIYWETKWPKLFSNRDYVFKRRYHIDKNAKIVYLVNKSTAHPEAPVLSNKQRVTEYWSYMVIRPHTKLDEPGIEFSLTYFDNPGISMPSSLSSWVTMTGMPAFLQRLRTASKNLREQRKGPSVLDDYEDKDSGDGHKPPREKGETKKTPADKSPSDSDTNPKCPKLPKMYLKKLVDVFFF